MDEMIRANNVIIFRIPDKIGKKKSRPFGHRIGLDGTTPWIKVGGCSELATQSSLRAAYIRNNTTVNVISFAS